MDYLSYTSELSKLYDQYGYSISQQVLQNFISSNKLDVNFSINIADVLKDLSSIHKTRSVLKKKTPPLVYQNSSANHAKIRTYNQYMGELEHLYIQNGKCVLSDDAIRKFISENCIDTEFKINIGDVKKDLQTIERKHKPVPPKPRVQQQPKSVTIQPRIKTYSQYLLELEYLYKQEGKVGLNETEIKKFIQDNKIDIVFGVNVEDVKKDLKMIEKKLYSYTATPIRNTPTKPVNIKKVETYDDYCKELKMLLANLGDKAFLDMNIKHFVQGIRLSRTVNVDDIRIDLVMIKANQTPSSSIAKSFLVTKRNIRETHTNVTYKGFTQEVSNMLLEHLDKIADKKKLKGLLRDYFCGKKKEINILIMLVENGMLDDMENETIIDFLFINRYVNGIVNNQGIDADMAREMAIVWCQSYGRYILRKEIRLI